MRPSHLPAFAFPALVLSAGLLGQSTFARHGQVVFGAGMPMPSSLGASPNDFPAGAVMRAGVLGTAGVQPVIDGDGTMLFAVRAALDTGLGITTTNAMALLRGRDGGDLRLVVRQDDPVAGLPTTTRINGALPIRTYQSSPFGGHLLVSVGLADAVVPTNTPATADSAHLLGTPGALQLLLREGDVVPAVGGGARYGEIESIGMNVNSQGRAVVRNRMQAGIGGVTTANDGIVLVGTVGNLVTMLREGSPWSGVGATGEIVAVPVGTDFPARNLRQLDDGRIVHDLRFAVPSGSATSTANDSAFAVWNGGIDSIVVREGDQAPGMPSGALFADNGTNIFAVMPNAPSNKAGAIVFTTTFPIGPGGVTADDDQAMFLHDGTTLHIVLREGEPAPVGPGVTFGFVQNSLQLNDAGQIAFAAALGGAVTAADDTAVFLGAPGSFAMVAREGGAVPGLPGHQFGSFAFPSFAIDERGHLLLLATVTNGTSRTVAMEYTPEHGLALFFDPVDPIATPAGSTTLPATLAGTLQFSSDNCMTLMNNHGDVGFLATSTGAESTTIGCTYVRGHVGAMFATPATVPATGGVPQQFKLECGPANANRFYFVLATSQGTRPGFPSPLGPQIVPLVFDPTWTNLSVSFANTSVWSGTFGFTDAAGVGVGPASFTLPAGATGLTGIALHHAAVLFDLSLVSTFVTEPVGLLLR
ncbi:MAG: hypothetical protein JNK15_08900 [Planctomycetes bacterium]|nr:hypothetical protein [Planctomycetota bacterium]